jgi:hypothetical protein
VYRSGRFGVCNLLDRSRNPPPGSGAFRISVSFKLISAVRALLEGFAAVAPDHEDCGLPDVFLGDHGREKIRVWAYNGSFEGFAAELSDIMASILTAEDVVRRIAAECVYVDERGAVGIRLKPAVAIVQQYGEQFRRGPQRKPRRQTPKPPRLL